MKTLIKNGLIYDGSGQAPQRKNILIENDKIAAITEQKDIRADETIDASGHAVTPGFIDTHRHCDLDALYNPEFGKIELAQGLTSIIGGNCGLAPIPAPEPYRNEIMNFIEPCLGAAPKQMSMVHFAEYMKALEEKELPLHVGSYIATGTLKASMKGYGKAPFTKQEMERAKTYIREGLEAGAAGLSMGVMYQPECYSSIEEMVELVSAAAPYGRPLACHIRGEGDNLLSSVQEIIEIARRAGVPLNISHFKATGVKNWKVLIARAIDLIEAARAKGEDITVDFYPYCGGSTTLFSLLPPSVMEDSVQETLQKLSGSSGKKQLLSEIYREHLGWDNMVTAIGWERILISSVQKEENKRFSSLSFQAASDMAGYDDPAAFLCDLLVMEEGKVGIIVLSMSQVDVDTVARLPYSMVISDSLYGSGDYPHPRLYGSFPKIIREYVKQRKVLTMEEAIKKMTFLPAKRLSLKKRGLLREGYYADINLFREEQLTDYAVYENPKQLCTGFRAVFIDGKKTVSEDQLLSRANGSVIRL
jgi:N-acyl-D-aspartate/D-glutamate deacylase